MKIGRGDVRPARSAGVVMLALCLSAMGCSGGSDATGAGGSAGSAGGAGGGGTAGSGGAGGSSGSENGPFITAPSCTGQVFRLEQPYAINTALWSGFTVDTQGIIYIAVADVTQLNDTSTLTDYPYLVQTASLDGTAVKTVMTGAAGDLFEGMVADDTSYYLNVFHSFSGKIVRGPRTGGAPETIYDGVISAGPIVDSTSVYFATSEGSKGSIFKIPKAGGAPMLISERADGKVSDLALDGGDLYWTESKDYMSDVIVQKLATGAAAPVALATLPHDHKPNTLQVGGGRLVYDVLLVATSTVELYTLAMGEAPRKIAADEGSPFLFNAGVLYYASRQGLKRATVPFDAPTLNVPRPMAFWGLTPGPTDVWYSEGTSDCVYKAPL